MAGWTSRRRLIVLMPGPTVSSAARRCSISGTSERRLKRCARLWRHPSHFQIPLSADRWKRRPKGAGHLGLKRENSSFMAAIKFGTDGWRAVIAEDFTFSNVERVAQATADYW